MQGTQEYFFTCPYCFETISFVLETLHGPQKYIEDCQVCCNPIEIQYQVTPNETIESTTIQRVQ